jgi:hypothetical protein
LALHGAGFGKFRVARQGLNCVYACSEKSLFPPLLDTDWQHIHMKIRQLGAQVDEGKQVGSFRNAYRPERHYMRGPGPKWHAKHTASLVAAASVQPVIAGDVQHTRAGRSQNAAMVWVGPIAAAAALGFAAVLMLA